MCQYHTPDLSMYMNVLVTSPCLLRITACRTSTESQGDQNTGPLKQADLQATAGGGGGGEAGKVESFTCSHVSRVLDPRNHHSSSGGGGETEAAKV